MKKTIVLFTLLFILLINVVGAESTKNSILKNNLDKTKKCLQEIARNEPEGLYQLAKLSFKIKHPILKRLIIRTAVLGLMKTTHPQFSSYRRTVLKKIGKNELNFLYTAEFYENCQRCSETGYIKINCRICKNSGVVPKLQS